MAWAKGNKWIVMVASSITFENEHGAWFYVGHFLALETGQPKGHVMSRSSGPYRSKCEADTAGPEKAGLEALNLLADGKWP